MRYKVTHTTNYSYAEPVSQCLNTAYILPRNTLSQSCIHSELIINPVPVSTDERLDYFGNRCCYFTIEQGHSAMTVTSTNLVEVTPSNDWSGLDFGSTCAQVTDMLKTSSDPKILLARHFLLDSPTISRTEQLRDYAAPLFSSSRPFLSAVRDLNQQIHTDFTYDPHFSDVSTPLSEVFEHRKGVCQDFAHLAIGCLRSLGYPAHCVSGYIETLPPPGQEKLVGTDATHAWFSVFSPSEGWFDLDPTNNTATNEQHIVTAWGRDYTDVAPLRGVIFGGGEQHTLDVSVDVRRV